MINQNVSHAQITTSPFRIIPLAASLALIVVNGAHAEEGISPARPPNPHHEAGFDSSQPPEPHGDWKFSLGIGSGYQPAFPGSRDYQAIAFTDLKIEYKDRFFAAPFEGIGYNVINGNGWRAGPILKFDFGRTEDDDNPFRIAGKKTNALKGLGDIDIAPEIGGFIEYNLEPFSYSLELRQGLGGHEGLIGDISLNYMGFMEQLGKPIVYSFGPHATYADSNYNDAYFGITPRQSANSGLSRYNANSGLVSYGVGAFAIFSITESVSLGVFGSYDRMANVVADSPLIQERGNENQLTIHIGMRYEFGH